MGLLLVGYSLEVMGLDSQYPLYLGFYTSMPMLMGPLVYLYVLSYTKKTQHFNPKFILHALPYIFFTVAVFLKLYLYSEGSVAKDIDVIEGSIVIDREFIDAPQSIVFYCLAMFRILYSPIYLVFAYFILQNHRKKIGGYFSYTENIDLKWLRLVVVMMIVLMSIVILVNILIIYNKVLPYRIGDNIIFSLLSIIVFLSGFYGIKQQIIFKPREFKNLTSSLHENANEKIESKKQYLKSGLSGEESQKLLQQLLTHMQECTPYVNGKLSLKEVADSLSISPNYLSQVINENLNKNFFDFVNQYRVEYVKKLIVNPDYSHLTILGVALESGFNSKSSFNNIFKKYTGFTPTQFIKNQNL